MVYFAGVQNTQEVPASPRYNRRRQSHNRGLPAEHHDGVKHGDNDQNEKCAVRADI